MSANSSTEEKAAAFRDALTKAAGDDKLLSKVEFLKAALDIKLNADTALASYYNFADPNVVAGVNNTRAGVPIERIVELGVANNFWGLDVTLPGNSEGFDALIHQFTATIVSLNDDVNKLHNIQDNVKS